MSTLKAVVAWILAISAPGALITISIRKISIKSKSGQRTVKQKNKGGSDSINLQAGNDINFQQPKDPQ